MVWEVWRLDDNGNEFIVEGDLRDESEADATIRRMETRGHKQLYFKRSRPEKDDGQTP